MAWLTDPTACGLCGERLELHSVELEVLEGYKLCLSDVARTEEDDEEEREEPHRVDDPTETASHFCLACAPKVKIGVERWLMRAIEARRNLADRGGESADADEE